MKIQRFEMTEVRVIDEPTSIHMVEDDNGDYVRYQDVKKILDILDEFGITDTGKLVHALMVTKDEGYL